MMSLRTRLVFGILLAMAVVVTDLSKNRLDTLHPDRKRFMELLYVPRARVFKILACGFDAPLSDMLWIQGLIYYSNNARSLARNNTQARYRYVYQLHHLITNLCPRFERAYNYGGMFLLSTGKENNILQGIHLLQKGVDYFNRAYAKHQLPAGNDKRWQLHMQIGNAYDTQLRAIHIAGGERMLARHDRRKALMHFKEAAGLPNAPELMAAVYSGLLMQISGNLPLEQRYDTQIEVWRNILKEQQSNKEFKEYAARQLLGFMQKRDSIRATRAIETLLSDACTAYRNRFGRLPARVDDLVKAGFMRSIPASPMDRPEADQAPGTPATDTWIILPDTTIRSLKLAKVKVTYDINLLYDAIFDSYHKHNEHLPGDLQQLVSDRILDSLPVHPLAAVGFHYTYDPVTGQPGVSGPAKNTVKSGVNRTPGPR